MPHKSVIFLWSSIFFIVGIGIATRTPFSETVVSACFFIGFVFFALFFFTRRIGVFFISICLLSFCVAFFRVSLLPEYATEERDFFEFEGVVVREPELFDAKQRIIVQSPQHHGLIQIDAALHPRWRVGDNLRIGCALQAPTAFDSFDYAAYLERFRISALCRYPTIERIGVEHSLNARMYAFKQHAIDRFQKTIAPPENTMIIGALFGNKRALPEEIATFFQRTGTSHVIVISGLHIVMLIVMMSKTLYFLGCSKKAQSIGSFLLIFLYIAITGFQSSAVRAALFGAITLGASFFGRTHSSLRVLWVAAALMLLANPLMLWYDVGFQLSFAATAGIILFNARIEKRLVWLPPSWRPLLSVTIASMITTAPIIIYHFHTFAPIGLIANIILVPMMTVIMIVGIVSIAVSLFSVEIGHIISLPLYYLIHLFIDIAAFFSAISWASISL